VLVPRNQLVVDDKLKTIDEKYTCQAGANRSGSNPYRDGTRIAVSATAANGVAHVNIGYLIATFTLDHLVPPAPKNNFQCTTQGVRPREAQGTGGPALRVGDTAIIGDESVKAAISVVGIFTSVPTNRVLGQFVYDAIQ
jgi:hypothetical protein